MIAKYTIINKFIENLTILFKNYLGVEVSSTSSSVHSSELLVVVLLSSNIQNILNKHFYNVNYL